MTEQRTCASAQPKFQREDRYFVIKRTDLIAADKAGKVAPAIFDAISAIGDILPHRDCLVIESDWPEYEAVWRMIEARVTGQAGSMVECPHRCGAMYANDSYGAGFIEGSGMCPACDAAMPAKDIVRALEPGDDTTPPELLAAKLIDAWGVVHGLPVPWEKAVEITAIATSMGSEERERLLAMADTPAAQVGQVIYEFDYRHANGEQHTVTVTREQVLEQMPDFIFEELCGKICNCQPVGETNVVECRCDEYAEEFQLVAATPAQGGE